MAYIVDYGIFDALETGFCSAVSSWLDGISSVVSAEGTIEGSTNISGNSADRTKEYLSTVYSSASTSFSLLLTTFRDNFLVYTNDYRSNIDGAGDTYIDTAELSDRSSSLQGQRSRIQQIAMSAEAAIKSVSDIVSVSAPDISAADAQIGTILSAIEELDNAINALESAHSSGDFGDMDALVTQLNNYIGELKVQSKEYKAEFTAESYKSLASISALTLAVNSAYESLQAQSAEIDAAAENLQARIEAEQAELEERKKLSPWLKIGSCVVGSIVAVAATAALTPVLGPAAVVVGKAAGGATSSALCAAVDEYVENGWETENWDVDRIKINGCIGAVTGTLGVCFPGVGPGVIISSIEGAVSTSYDQWAESGQITDTDEIAENMIIKATGSFFGKMIGTEVGDELENWVNSNGEVGKLTVESVSEVGKSFSNKFSSTVVKESCGFISSLLQGESLDEAYYGNVYLTRH